jgi:exosome complex component RRP42
VEISASAGTDYEGRLGDSLGGELGKALERSLLGATSNAGASLSAAASGERGTTARDGHHGAGAALDMAALGIQKGKTAWVLQVDALVLNAEGSLLDALSIAVKAALADTKIPKVTAVAGPGAEDPMELELDDDPEECARLDVAGVPLIVSLTRVGLHAVVDATHEEEAHMSAALSVAVDGAGLVRSVGKRGGGGARGQHTTSPPNPQRDSLLAVYQCSRPCTLAASSSLAWPLIPCSARPDCLLI